MNFNYSFLTDCALPCRMQKSKFMRDMFNPEGNWCDARHSSDNFPTLILWALARRQVSQKTASPIYENYLPPPHGLAARRWQWAEDEI